MNFINLDLRKLIVVLAIMAIPLLTVNEPRNPEESHWALKPFAFALGSLQGLYSGFSAGVRGTTSLYLDLIDIKVENQKLASDNAELRAQLGTLTELNLENERLNGLLNFKQNSEMDLLAAKVIGKDLLPDHKTLTINRGSFHGLKKNMAAITVGGVVGYVFRTSTYTSQILLLTDRYAVIDATVQRSRARGIVEGGARDQCRLRYLKRGDDVQVGDLVVTSGLDNIFPKGFPVATVKNVTKSQYGLSQEVELKPVVSPQTIEEIFVILNTNNEDFEKLEEVAPPETPSTSPTPTPAPAPQAPAAQGGVSS